MMAFLPLVFVLGSLQGLPTPQRARDPWVFRSVLDQKPRMVTFALNDAMWVAYDATTCTLYKAWKGGVHFDGAVYTTVHGPQPTSQGTTYTRGVDGPAWEVFVDEKKVEARERWIGYVFHDGRCTMNYEIALPDGRRIDLLETPEFVRAEDLFDEAQRGNWSLESGQPGLLRSFLASALPADVKITLKVSTDGMVGKFCEFEERAEVVETKTAAGGVESHAFMRLALTAAKRDNNLVLFFPAIVDAKATDAKNAPGEAAPKAEKK